MKKRWHQVLLLWIASACLFGCSAQNKNTDTNNIQAQEIQETKTENRKNQESLGGKAGISFPDQENEVLRKEAETIKKALESKDYEVELVYAGNDGKKQAQQIRRMIENKVSSIVVCPVDSSHLKKSVEQAKKRGIAVISYDKLLANTEGLSYYVGFDYKQIGKEAAKYLVKNKKLDRAQKEKKSYTIEFFMGALDDMNGRIQMDAVMEVLDPYFNQGVLRCESLRTAYEDVSIFKESGEIAEKTCDNIMKANYMDEPVSMVYVGNEEMTAYVAAALKEQSDFAKHWPMIVGVGSNQGAFERIEDGTQALSIYCLRAELPKLCADVVDKSIQGEEMKDLDKVNNGTAEIDAIFAEAKSMDKSNYQQIQKEVDKR